MPKLSTREVLDAAHMVRGQFETRTYNWERIRKRYAAYAGYELDRGEAESLWPMYNCGLAAVALHDLLGTGEIIRAGVGRYDNAKHTFLELDSIDTGPVIADITADQFGGPPVYVGKLVLPWSIELPSYTRAPSWATVHGLA